MTEPKPLTKEEREKLSEFLGDGTDERCFLNQHWAQKVLAAELFWREAVKNVPIPPSADCPFCNRALFTIHKPSCHWLLAQK